MTTDVIASVEGLEKLAPEWRGLCSRCARPAPFQSPDWLLPWTRHLFRGGSIFALAMRRAGELMGFAPLFRWGIERRTVSFLGAGISDYGDLLCAAGCEDECADAVWSFLDERRDEWDAIDLREVPCGSGLLKGRAAEECSVCPVLELNTWPESMDPKQRTDWRRANNRLRRNTEACFSMTGDIDAFFRLHEARWGDMDGALRRFHREASAQFCAAGLLRLSMLHLDGAAAASIYGFRAGATLYCYLSGFNPALAKQSPGAVLLGWAIEQAAAEGVREVDFLRQPESYKYLWGARDRVTYRIESYTGISKTCKNA